MQLKLLLKVTTKLKHFTKVETIPISENIQTEKERKKKNKRQLIFYLNIKGTVKSLSLFFVLVTIFR